MLKIRELNARYGSSHVLHGLSLEVNAGEIVGLLGRNGVGKTTIINSIIGFVEARKGSIEFCGRSLMDLPPHAVARQGIGLVPQGRRIFPDLKVHENLTLGAVVLKSNAGEVWTLERVYRLFPVLAERANERADSLSGGEQQMMVLGRALMTNPSLLLIDELSEGLAPIIVRSLVQVLSGLKSSGMSILLVEQNLETAVNLADRIYVLSKGAVVHHGISSSVAENDSVKKLYLGV